MKSLGKFPDRFFAEIAGQPDAIRRAAATLEEQRGEVARLRAALRRATSVVFTGMGGSYDQCYVPVTVLARRGLASEMVVSSELLHFRLRALPPGALLVCVSQSGESAEVVAVVERLQQEGRALPRSDAGPVNGPPGRLIGEHAGVLVASVTNGLDNTLARAATIRLDTRVGAEEGPSTMTFAASLAALAAVADEVSGDRLPALKLQRAALELERLLGGAEDEAARLAAWFGKRAMLTLIGRGGARAAAEMGALTIKESSGLLAESLEAGQFRHGPLEMAGPELAAMIFATEKVTRELDRALAADLVAAGSAVYFVSQTGEAPAGAARLAIGPVADAVAPAVAVLPAQLLAWRLARRRGRTPGEFTVASKVTLRE